MITVPEATKKIVERSRYLSEAMSKDLINLTSLARYIQPELEQMLIKKVSKGSIVMALKRLQIQLKPKDAKGNIFTQPPEMMIRSGLFIAQIQRTEETEKLLGEQFFNRVKGTFTSISVGATEIQIVGTDALFEKFTKNIKPQHLLASHTGVSQITIYLPPIAATSAGVYYFFLKSLAWEGINIIASASSGSEFTLFFEDKDINRAFGILSSLFTKNIL